MTAVDATPSAAASAAPAPAVPTGSRHVRPRHLATMLGSALSAQVGAASGAHAFGAIGPAGVVAVRQLVAVCVLLPVARPRVRQLTWSQWWPVIGLAGVFAVMNLSLYTAIDRLGLGLAITLEFLGPLCVAIARSRTALHLGIAAVAAGGVYVLLLPDASSDWSGIALALFAACCWAGYILLNRVVGSRLTGVQGPALATAITATVYLPYVVHLVASGRMTWPALGFAVGAGLLSSVLPFAGDLTVLRHVPPRVFGVFQSMHPVLAALVGTVLLGQLLGGHEWLGLTVIVLANAVTVATARD
jgi:inner membrane transporter RhtA